MTDHVDRPLFRPTARETNGLLVVGFLSLGYALYLRYLAVEFTAVGLACQAGLDTWLCLTRKTATMLFTHSLFGWCALALALLNLLRPSAVLFGLALIPTGLGLVLYNAGLSGLAVGLLILSFARPASARA
jgi:hypothetical protein